MKDRVEAAVEAAAKALHETVRGNAWSFGIEPPPDWDRLGNAWREDLRREARETLVAFLRALPERVDDFTAGCQEGDAYFKPHWLADALEGKDAP